MSLESFPGSRSPFSAPTPELTRPSVGNRLQEALKNPELQAEAKAAARRIGGAAIKGAVEGSGLARIDDDGDVRVRKLGVIKAVLNPRKAAVEAAKGAVSGTRKGVINEAFHQTQKQLGNMDQRQFGQIGSNRPPTELESSWSDYPVESSAAIFAAPDAYEQPVSKWGQMPTSDAQESFSWGSHSITPEESPSFNGSTQQNGTSAQQPFKWS